MTNACGLNCDLCPAVRRCGKTCNFCRVGYLSQSDAIDTNQEMGVRRQIMESLGGLDLAWLRRVNHPELPELPSHLPVFVQAYADRIAVPWVALHGGRLSGVNGQRLTSKHWNQPLHQVYRLAPDTKIAMEFNVVDRVLEGLWTHQHTVIAQLVHLRPDLLLTPNFSVWYNDCRFQQLIAIRRSFWYYHRLVEAGLPAVPDIGFSFFEPDGRLWAEWDCRLRLASARDRGWRGPGKGPLICARCTTITFATGSWPRSAWARSPPPPRPCPSR